MRSVIYGVGVYDATTLVMVMLALVMVTILGIVLPILKIAKIDLANTLREE
jgi:ABC-type antimicrobial peptide transport system permease subunit